MSLDLRLQSKLPSVGTTGRSVRMAMDLYVQDRERLDRVHDRP